MRSGRNEGTIDHVPIAELFEKYVPRKEDGSLKVIDLMLMDIEGGEFEIIDAFAGQSNN